MGSLSKSRALKKRLAEPDPNDPDHEDRLEWKGGPFDETDIDEDQIRKQLAKIIRRRQRKTLNPRTA